VKDRRHKRSVTQSIATIVPWRLVPSIAGEAARWEHSSGRWVTVRVGHGADLGTAFVEASDGRRQKVDTYEAALDLARTWRD
jgi:hypothetical protein